MDSAFAEGQKVGLSPHQNRQMDQFHGRLRSCHCRLQGALKSANRLQCWSQFGATRVHLNYQRQVQVVQRSCKFGMATVALLRGGLGTAQAPRCGRPRSLDCQSVRTSHANTCSSENAFTRITAELVGRAELCPCAWHDLHQSHCFGAADGAGSASTFDFDHCTDPTFRQIEPHTGGSNVAIAKELKLGTNTFVERLRSNNHACTTAPAKSVNSNNGRLQDRAFLLMDYPSQVQIGRTNPTTFWALVGQKHRPSRLRVLFRRERNTSSSDGRRQPRQERSRRPRLSTPIQRFSRITHRPRITRSHSGWISMVALGLCGHTP